ncbi:MAG: hypothetical protein HRU76_13495 [Phycisphaeraceae bacterium]|nr:hypothetical protein [Phycisphaerales bacterium]QOJ18538.1 MAG: hypothetical protein HRU76_13495 [Phycisphaeraceae bacterium]
MGWRVIKTDAEGGTVFGPADARGADLTPQQRFEQALARTTSEDHERLARALGVASTALADLDAAWDDPVWLFPERDARGAIIGVLRRYGDGKKKSLWKAKRGLIVPRSLPAEGLILIVEGPTDVAAALSMGLAAVGRPSAAGGVKHLAELLKGREILVLGENDQKPDGSHPGRDGALGVATRLAAAWGVPVHWALPPTESKDIRAWFNAQSVDPADTAACHDAGQRFMAAIKAAVQTVEPPANGQSTDSGKECDAGGGRKSQATELVDLCDGVELFHDDDTGYASVHVEDHIETLAIRGRGFRRWLARQYFEATDKAPGNQMLADAINVIEGHAFFRGPQVKVHVRLADHEGVIYLDLADSKRNIVQIDATGWRVVAQAPVRFRRPKGVLALPVPVKGGSVTELRQFVNVVSDVDFILLVSWLVGLFRVGWPQPILIVISEQGSGKSTSMRLLRRLVDPNTAGLRSSPREPRDLMIAATNGWFVALDNLSSIPDWLSDALCRLSTGGGFGTRTLYENDEEQLFDALRPVMLNGIEEVATRGDLLDRAIRIGLPSIPEDKRVTESALYSRFEEARPRILGALLDAVSTALSRINGTHLAACPRMADFAHWIVAAEPGLPWKTGEFMEAYTANRASAHDVALESTPVADAIRRFMVSRKEWEGRATDLLAHLDQLVDEKVRHSRDWPKRPHTLSSALRRLAPNLRQVGVDLEFPKPGHRSRSIIVRTVPQKGVASVAERRTLFGDPAKAADRDADHPDRDAPVPGASVAGTAPGAAENHLATHRDARDAELGHQSSPRLADFDEVEERAAILEFEQGLSRQDAEAIARGASESALPSHQPNDEPPLRSGGGA